MSYAIVDTDSDKIKDLLNEMIAKRKKQIHPEHNIRFNYDCQLWIDCIEWALKKIKSKIPNDRIEGIIKVTIKDLEKGMSKSTNRSDTDDFWTRIETLQWILFVILAIRNGNKVVI